jgi:hypothetical protein
VTKSTPNREQWIKDTCSALGITPTTEQLEKAHHIVWYNRINPQSLRITYEGFKWFSRNTKFHQIDLVNDVYPKQMLQLEKLLNSPYYIRKQKQQSLFVSSEQDAIMLQLYSGDLNTYLNNLENTNG